MNLSQTANTPRRRPLRSFFDELFDDVLTPFAVAQTGQRNSLPAMNLAETADAFRLSFEFPGVAEKDVNVHIDGNQLVVSAERRFETEKAEGAEYHRVEHRYGSFARSLTLPKDVNTEAIHASMKNGVLTVVLPKVEPSRARKIEVKGDQA
jgi:HSP20 family protein